MAPPGKHLTASCRYCGKDFRQSRSDQGFCSRPCYGRAWRAVHGRSLVQRPHREPLERRVSYVTAKPLVPRHCDKCGVQFEARPRQRFCCKKCQDGARPPRITNGLGKGGATRGLILAPRQACLTCGTLFYAEPKRLRVGRGRYCSVRCRHADRKPEDYPQFSGRRGRGGRRADLGNQYFRSRWEANWARYLNWLKSLGEIQSWKFEPKTFQFGRIKRGGRFYTPDFLVINKDGRAEYHEVKGYMDPGSATKLRRMARYYPDVKVILIDRNAYADMARKVGRLIPGWEDTKKAVVAC